MVPSALQAVGSTLKYQQHNPYHQLARLRAHLPSLVLRSSSATAATPTSQPQTARAAAAALAQSATTKEEHLLHQPRFRRSFVLTLAAGLALLAAASTSNELWVNALFAQATLQNHFQSLAFRLELWSLMGLLSSSCCALQLLLNLASVGCAGFNTWLGPVRPHLLALTVLLQACMWRATLAGRPARVGAAAASSLLTCLLSLLPELLHAWVHRRGGAGADSMQSGEELCFQVGGMGCTACTAKVRGVLEALPGVVSAEVALESERARIRSTDGDVGARAVEALKRAGFEAAPAPSWRPPASTEAARKLS